MSIEEKLKEHGLVLPAAPMPVANYLPFRLVGSTLYISGQVSRDEDTAWCGKLGKSFCVADGQAAARVCVLNIFAQAKAALDGDLGRLRGCLRLGGYVNCTEDFCEHPQVMNGASDLVVALMGEPGRHTRIAVGVPALPLGVAVEIDALFDVETVPPVR